MVVYRSTNPESVISSRDPACLRRHARSLEETHNPSSVGATNGTEMKDHDFLCPKNIDSSRDLLCLRRHARSLWYYIGRPTRKVSIPQEIPHVFEGTLDLLRNRIIRFGVGREMTKPITRGREMRNHDFCVRKKSIPQEISCAFEGTLDLYWKLNCS